MLGEDTARGGEEGDGAGDEGGEDVRAAGRLRVVPSRSVRATIRGPLAWRGRGTYSLTSSSGVRVRAVGRGRPHVGRGDFRAGAPCSSRVPLRSRRSASLAVESRPGVDHGREGRAHRRRRGTRRRGAWRGGSCARRGRRWRWRRDSRRRGRVDRAAQRPASAEARPPRRSRRGSRSGCRSGSRSSASPGRRRPTRSPPALARSSGRPSRRRASRASSSPSGGRSAPRRTAPPPRAARGSGAGAKSRCGTARPTGSRAGARRRPA